MQRAAVDVPALRLGTAAYPVRGQCRVIDPVARHSRAPDLTRCEAQEFHGIAT